MTSSLPHHKSEHQRSVKKFWSSILGKNGIVPIFELITELLTAFIGKNTHYNTKTMDSKIIDSGNSETCIKWLLDVKYMILVTYYCQTAKTRAINESTDGPTGQPADNLPNSDGLWELAWTILNCRFGYNDNRDRQFGNSLVPTRHRTWRDSLKPVLTPVETYMMLWLLHIRL